MRFGQESFFGNAHAVFAGDRATQLDGVVENFLHRVFHPLHFLHVALVGEKSGMQVAIAHVAESADAQLMPRGHFLDEPDHLCQFAARYGGVFENGGAARRGPARKRPSAAPWPVARLPRLFAAI